MPVLAKRHGRAISDYGHRSGVRVIPTSRWGSPSWKGNIERGGHRASLGHSRENVPQPGDVLTRSVLPLLPLAIRFHRRRLQMAEVTAGGSDARCISPATGRFPAKPSRWSGCLKQPSNTRLPTSTQMSRVSTLVQLVAGRRRMCRLKIRNPRTYHRQIRRRA
jgi:hypothetical protein